jgi:hypothetical protein
VSKFRRSFCAKKESRLICRQLRPFRARQLGPLALAFLLVLWSPIQVAAESEEIYLLNQTVAALGPTKVYVSQNAIHFMCLNLGYEAVCKAPTWQVVAFNPKAKVYIKRTLSELIMSGFIPGKWFAPQIVRNEAAGHGQFCGHSYSKFTGVETHSKGEHHTNTSLTGVDFGQRPKGYEQWNIDDMPFDRHVGESLAIMSHARLGPGIPIANFSLFQKTPKEYNIKTESIRKVTIAEAGLDYPSLRGYQEINAIQQLCFANKKKELSTFFEDLGVGEEFGAKDKQGSAPAGAQGKK